MMKKVRTGVYGLNALMDGGINEHTTTVVIGSPGAGKTTFATQFLRRGLLDNDDAVFITLDEAPTEIVKNSKLMGWDDIDSYISDGSLIFVDAGGKQFSHFIQKELAEFVDEWEGHNARIAIDPLTPVLWSVKEKYEQRELVSYFLRETRKIGTVLCTLEEHGSVGDLSAPDLVIPMYLADNVIHLRYASLDSPERRELKIIKCRSSKHSRYWHPYSIMKGVGVYVKKVEELTRRRGVAKAGKIVKEKALSLNEDRLSRLPPTAKDNFMKTIEALAEQDLVDVDPDELLDLILEEYSVDEIEHA
jgi:circadian clock protein KaiC